MEAVDVDTKWLGISLFCFIVLLIELFWYVFSCPGGYFSGTYFQICEILTRNL